MKSCHSLRVCSEFHFQLGCPWPVKCKGEFVCVCVCACVRVCGVCYPCIHVGLCVGGDIIMFGC